MAYSYTPYNVGTCNVTELKFRVKFIVTRYNIHITYSYSPIAFIDLPRTKATKIAVNMKLVM